MRKEIVAGMIIALIAIAFAVMPMNVDAPGSTSITPSKGKVGNVAVIHGTGFDGGAVTVTFGRAEAKDVKVPNNKTVKVTIPAKDVRDPDPVPVKVTVDGVLAGEVPFSYKIIGPEPQITAFIPWGVPAGMEFDLEIVGTDFTTQQGRKPDQVLLVGPDTIWGSVIADSSTDTAFTAAFPLAAIIGSYEILVGFTDGSGASAEGFEIIP